MVKNIILVGAILFIGLSLYYIGRSLYFLHKSRALFSIAEQYPTHYFVGNPSDRLVRVSFLGDSTMVGVGTTDNQESLPYLIAKSWSAQGTYLEIHNYASIGARLETVVNEQAPRLSANNTDIVIIAVGANDSTHLTGIASYRDHLNTLANALSGYKALLVTTPNMAPTPLLPWPVSLWINQRAQKQNALLGEIASNHHLPVADIYTLGVLDPAKETGLYAGDHFHPSAKGYRRWATIIASSL